MVENKKFQIVLLLSSLIVMYGIAQFDTPNADVFKGVCVRSYESFSILSDGNVSVAVDKPLELGRVYRIEGRMYETANGVWIRASKIEPSNFTDIKMETLRGAYWPSRDVYLLTPSKIKLAFPINASKGELVEVNGISYGGKFYPLSFEAMGISDKPEDGMPWLVEGVILYSNDRTVLWNGSEEINVYLPYGLKLQPGTKVKVLGIVRFYSTLTLFVDSREDVVVLETADRVPLSSAKIGDIGVGKCRVIETGRSLKLDCVDIRLYGFYARVGDLISVEALRRKSSLLCLNCEVLEPRELLPNSICEFSNGAFAKVSGTVSEVKIYKNGFGLANLTNGDCWVLLKLRKSLGVVLEENETVTAYGMFTTYRDMPALEISSGEDVCSGKC